MPPPTLNSEEPHYFFGLAEPFGAPLSGSAFVVHIFPQHRRGSGRRLSQSVRVDSSVAQTH